MRALCVGNGPSLKSYGDNEWGLMRAYYDLIIVVNRYYLRPIANLNPDWLCVADVNCVREYLSAFNSFSQLTPTGFILNNDIVDFMGLEWFKRHGDRCICVHTLYQELYGSSWPKLERIMHMPAPRNVMLFAIPMAVTLGATEVDLIGVDMTKHHLHYYDTKETLTRNERLKKYELKHPEDPLSYHPRLENLVQVHYKRLKEWMDTLSVPLRNLTRGGNRIHALGGDGATPNLQAAEWQEEVLCRNPPNVRRPET